MPLLNNLDVFYGDLTANLAYVYARLPRSTEPSSAEPGEWSLTGTVRGPRCLHAQTLPTMSRLVDMGPGPTTLARAIVTEPCFWSPDLPALYDVTVKLQRGSEVMATAQRELGLRALGARGRSLSLDGKTHVLRGVSDASTTARLPRVWHEALAMYVTNEAKQEALSEASQWGAMVLVELTVADGNLASRLRELARVPAVAIVAIRGSVPGDFSKKMVAPNLLLAQVVQGGSEIMESWADVTIADGDELDWIRDLALRMDKPIVVRRKLAEPRDITDSRAACDLLQRELAPIGQFAGYVV